RYDIPDSVIGFLRGELGTPAGGWPEPFREKALAGRYAATAESALSSDDRKALDGDSAQRRATLNRLLFPGPTGEFLAHRDTYGDTTGLSANQFFYGLRYGEEHRVQLEKGVTLLIGLEAISEPDERGMRTVMCILNGQLRPIAVRDRAIASEVKQAEKADRNDPRQVAAPFAGVVTLAVTEGDVVAAGDALGTIEAMKMEASITAPQAGTVARIAIASVQQVDGGDLLLVMAAQGAV
ncbi:biotin/lipoyl-containing protein, partial [Nocardia grenadensis]|uniref:biotin/lipoyl-containing protein n=1 Tax=Nocardia grenadensis TaxID=931537 RepID=UPI000A9C9E42